MKNRELTSKEVVEMQLNYPPGTRIVLNHMEDPYAPVPPGTRGTVRLVDDAGTIHPQWDNGRTLAVIPGIDSFRKLTAQELAQEQQAHRNPDCPAVSQNSHPRLFGYSSQCQKELNSVQEVANFIFTEGLKSDVLITTSDGTPFIRTIGFFIDKIASMEYREALLTELVPLQMGMDVSEMECNETLTMT